MIIIASLLISATTSIADRTVRVGTHNIFPLVYMTSDSVPGGLCVRIIEHAAARRGWNVEYVHGTWHEQYQRLIHGQIDIIAGIAYHPERDSILQFTRQTIVPTWGRVYSHRKVFIETILDLQGKRVGVMRGGVFGNALRQRAESFGVDCEFVELDNYRTVVQMIDRKELDAGALERFHGSKYGDKHSLKATPIVFLPTQIKYAAIWGRNADVLDALDAEIAEQKNTEGSDYHSFYDKWISPPDYSGMPWWLIWSLTGAGLLLLLLSIWGLILRYQVRSRTRQLTRQNERLASEVSERFQAEIALRESERNYRELIESARTIILRFDTHGTILFLNEYGQQFFRYDEEDLIGRNVVGTIVPEVSSAGDNLADLMKELTNNPDQYAVHQNENIRSDGSTVWVAWSNRSIRNHDGETTGVLAVGTDITARKHAEEELQTRLLHEAAVLQCSRELSQIGPFEENMETALGSLLDATGSRQICLYRYIETQNSQTRLQLVSKVSHSESDIAVDPAFLLDIPFGLTEADLEGTTDVFAGSVEELGGHPLQSYLKTVGVEALTVVAVRAEGSLWGILAMDQPRGNGGICDTTGHDMALLRTAAPIIGVAIERRHAEDLLQAQRNLSVSMSSAFSLKDSIQLCTDAVLHVSGMDAVTFYLADADKRFSLADERNVPQELHQACVEFGECGIMSNAVRNGRAIVFDEESGGCIGNAMWWLADRFSSVVLVPVVHEGVAVAAVLAASYSERRVSSGVTNALESIASQVGGTIARLQTVDKLKTLQKRYRLVVENAYEAIVVIQDGYLKFWNPGAIALSGYSNEDIGEVQFADFVHTDDRERMVNAHLRRLAGDSIPTSSEFRLLTRDGQAKWTEMTGRRIDWEGRPAVLLFLTDIDERRRAEEALRRSEEQYRTLVESVNDVIYTTDLNGIFTYVSPVMERLTGYTSDEFLGVTFERFIHEDDRETLVKQFQRRIAGKSGMSEYRIRAKDGSLIHIRSSSRPLIVRGEVIGITGVIADISRWKKAELALRQSESNLSATLDSIGDGVITTDIDGFVTRMNPVAETLTGWSSEDALGNALQDVFPVFDTRKTTQPVDPVEKIMNAEKAAGLTSHVILRRRDGREFRIADSGAPIRDTDGDIIGTVLVFRDITEQFIEDERRRQSQKMESVGRLAGGIAHDFNNLLGGILGYAQLLEEFADVDETVGEYAENIAVTAERAADLTRKLLAFSRKSGRQDEPVDIHAIIDDTAQLLMRTVDRRIQFRINKDADHSTVNGDAAQLQNALLNLGVNARDAMPDGGLLTFTTVVVTLDELTCQMDQSECTAGDYIEISVTDTGKGMDKETLAHIFEPFFTTKAPGEGTGLGLATTYGTVHDHGGMLNVYSEVGRGTQFKLYLPLMNRPGETAQPDPITEPIVGTGRILIVDDEAVIRGMASAMLENLGYETVVAENGKEALEIFRSRYQEFNLVLLDMIMPEINGRDTFRAMRTIDPDVKALISSGFSFGVEEEELLDEGILGFIQKPYRVLELSQAVTAVMQGIGYSATVGRDN